MLLPRVSRFGKAGSSVFVAHEYSVVLRKVESTCFSKSSALFDTAGFCLPFHYGFRPPADEAGKILQ